MASITPNQPINFTIDGWKEYISQSGLSLDLKNRDLIDSQIITLAQALKDNTTVSRIDLSHNKITPVGAKALADLLRANITIAGHPLLATGAIQLGSNPLGKEGLLAITTALVDSGRAGYCLDLDDDIGITEEDCEELIEDPSLKELQRRTEEQRKALYPDGDCIII